MISIFTILVVLFFLMMFGAPPTWSHTKRCGYGPSGGLGLMATVLIILLLMGRG